MLALTLDGTVRLTRRPRPAPRRGECLVRVVRAGICATDMELTPIVIEEVTVIGSRCGPFAPALRLLTDRRVRVAPLISARFPLREGVKALRAARTRGMVKVLLTHDD